MHPNADNNVINMAVMAALTTVVKPKADPMASSGSVHTRYEVENSISVPAGHGGFVLIKSSNHS